MNSDFDKNLTYFENNLNSDDIPTVFIHGVGLNSSMWDPQKSYFKNKNIGFFSYIFIFLISIIAFFLIVETFEYQINNIFPNFGNYIIYVYETLNNILILIKDLFKSY